MKAITREEKIISGENLTPITRKEMFLAKASGQNVQTPTPITREEIFLSKITGGGGSVEGTAIPVGEKVEKIYFNTALSVEETNAYLSQLSYVQTELMEYPICGIWGYMTSQNTTIIYAMAEPLSSNLKRCYVGGIIINNDTGTIRDIFEIFNPAKDSNVQKNKGFATMDYDSCVQLVYGTAFYWETISATPISEFMGLPLGLENEKIKNVLSITPFGASGGTSNEPTAYTVSSVDELPSDAVDGSMAIVESDNTCYIRENGEWVLMGDGVLVCNDISPDKDKVFNEIKEISCPNATSIGDNAFMGCTALTSINLPNATSIGDNAFAYCGSLSTIILRNIETMCSVNLTAILDTKIATIEGIPTGEGFIYVPTSLYEDYVANFTEQATYLLTQTGVPQEEAVVMAEQISRAVLRKIEDYPEICGA